MNLRENVFLTHNIYIIIEMDLEWKTISLNTKTLNHNIL